VDERRGGEDNAGRRRRRRAGNDDEVRPTTNARWRGGGKNWSLSVFRRALYRCPDVRLYRRGPTHLQLLVCYGLNRLHVVKVRLQLHLVVRLVSRSLNLLPPHPPTQLLPIPQKELVVVPPRVRASREPLEPVEIQLSLEGRDFGVLEVVGHRRVGELTDALDLERAPVGEPADYRWVRDGEEGEELGGEGVDDAAGVLAAGVFVGGVVGVWG